MPAVPGDISLPVSTTHEDKGLAVGKNCTAGRATWLSDYGLDRRLRRGGGLTLNRVVPNVPRHTGKHVSWFVGLERTGVRVPSPPPIYLNLSNLTHTTKRKPTQ